MSKALAEEPGGSRRPEAGGGKGRVRGNILFFVGVLLVFGASGGALAGEIPGAPAKAAPLPSALPATPSPASGLPPPTPAPVESVASPAPLSRNGPDALSAYRKSWNPMTSGPDLMPQADTLPEGEVNVRFFMYGRLTQAQYSDSGGITGLPPGFSQTQLLDLFAMFYGIDQNTELVFLPSVVTTFSTQNGTSLDGSGLNDLSLGIKHRWVIQDPGSLRPSFTTAMLVTLPLTSWLGTPVPAGGLPPINVVPSTHFGSPSLTGIAMLRKNEKPLRLIGDLYYTFSFPNSISAAPGASPAYSQFGDLFQYRLGVEDVVDDKTGLGFILEIAGLSGLPFSVDGMAINTHPQSFNLVGVQPTVEYNITPRLVASFGVLLPAFGNNEYLATTPNFSLWYYFQGAQDHLLPR